MKPPHLNLFLRTAALPIVLCALLPARAAERTNEFSQDAVICPSTLAGKPVADGTPRDAFHVHDGFRVERVFEVPREQLGSWVCLALDGKGRILAADQGRKGICRITPAPLDRSAPTKVERLDIKVSGVQGMLYAFDSLYLSVNSTLDNGLYRARDTDGDDQFDELTKLKDFTGPSGEHGPHALRLSPDGKWIYLIAGNHIDPPFSAGDELTHAQYSSSVPTTWGEDTLLPRIWDPNGHARGRMAPGGWIAKTDPDGKCWHMISIGYRNAYDFAFSNRGELFTYDSDMEWDMGMPWYRPTRLVHVTDGSEYGWRSGSAVWPAYYVDSLPPITEMGPGSPTGVTFGYGTAFPTKYQSALFICDWTFGTIYAVDLIPDGPTFQATREEFLSRTPLAVADALVAPDKAMYFVTGGRNTQSELFRVTYDGDESTERPSRRDVRDTWTKKGMPPPAIQRSVRHALEIRQLPSASDTAAKEKIDYCTPYLGSTSHPFNRYAARVVLEFQPVDLWKDNLFSSTDPEVLLQAVVALAHRNDKELQSQLLEVLGRLSIDTMDEWQQLEALRAYQLVFIRLGEPDEATRSALVGRLDPLYPAKNDLVNRELSTLLVYLKSPTVVAKTMELLKQPTAAEKPEVGELISRNKAYGDPIAAMLASPPDAQRIHYACVLREAREGWTFDLRRAYFAFLNDAAQHSGGRSFQGFLKSIDHDAYDNMSAEDRKLIDDTGIRQPFVAPKLPKPEGPGRDWTVADVTKSAEPGLYHRDFQKGRRAYSAARCIVCHRFAGEGGAAGPDLTQIAGRFGVKDLAEAIIEPSKTIPDQYRTTIVQTDDGRSISGRILGQTEDTLILLVDPEDHTKVVDIAKGTIEHQDFGKTSLMPADLLKPLSEAEVLDLLAYLLSRGEPDDPMFRK